LGAAVVAVVVVVVVAVVVAGAAAVVFVVAIMSLVRAVVRSVQFEGERDGADADINAYRE
jgi:hypothetical protein